MGKQHENADANCASHAEIQAVLSSVRLRNKKAQEACQQKGNGNIYADSKGLIGAVFVSDENQ
jgi:hypothetical protein